MERRRVSAAITSLRSRLELADDAVPTQQERRVSAARGPDDAPGKLPLRHPGARPLPGSTPLRKVEPAWSGHGADGERIPGIPAGALDGFDVIQKKMVILRKVTFGPVVQFLAPPSGNLEITQQ